MYHRLISYRICVEAALPEGSLFMAQVFCTKHDKITRHVQGVSHWAPSCIGPYAQASKVYYHNITRKLVRFMNLL